LISNQLYMPHHHKKMKLFEREQDRTPVSSPEVLIGKKHQVFGSSIVTELPITRSQHV
jgi:hypothetical protein